MPRKRALLTVFLVVLVDLIGFGIVLPHLAFYAERMGGTPLQIGLLYSAYSIAQLVFSPLWGSLSDRVGRRPVMLISTAGAVLAYLFFAYSRSLAWLFAARLFAGVMAGNISTAQAYIADVTPPEERTRGMGLLGAAFGIGFVIGPALGAGILRLTWAPSGDANPYAALGFFAAALSAVSFVLVWATLPESLKERVPEQGLRVVRSSVFSPGFWRDVAAAGASSPVFGSLLLSAFLLAFGQSSLYGAFPLFCAQRLALSPGRVGLLYVWMGLVAVIVQGGMIRPLERRFGERPLFLTGAVLLAAGLAAIPLASGTLTLAAALFVMSVGGSLSGPTLTSLLSKQSDPSRYGLTLGTSQGLSALGRAIGPSWGGALYARAVGLPFWATAAVLTAAIWIGMRLVRVHARPAGSPD